MPRANVVQLDSDEATAHRGEFVDKHRAHPRSFFNSSKNNLGDEHLEILGGHQVVADVFVPCGTWATGARGGSNGGSEALRDRVDDWLLDLLDHSVNSNMGPACSTQAGANIGWSCYLRKRHCLDYTTCATGQCEHARCASQPEWCFEMVLEEELDAVPRKERFLCGLWRARKGHMGLAQTAYGAACRAGVKHLAEAKKNSRPENDAHGKAKTAPFSVVMKTPVCYLSLLKKHFAPFVATGMATLAVGGELTANELKVHVAKSHPHSATDVIKPPDTAGVVPVTIEIDFRISSPHPIWDLTHVHEHMPCTSPVATLPALHRIADKLPYSCFLPWPSQSQNWRAFVTAFGDDVAVLSRWSLIAFNSELPLLLADAARCKGGRIWAIPQVERARRIVNGSLQLGGGDVEKGQWRYALGFHRTRRSIKVGRMTFKVSVVGAIGRGEVTQPEDSDDEDGDTDGGEDSNDEGEDSDETRRDPMLAGIFASLPTWFPDEFDRDEWFDHLCTVHADEMAAMAGKIVSTLKDGTAEFGKEFSDPVVLRRFFDNKFIKDAMKEHWPNGDGQNALQNMVDEGGSLAALASAMADTLTAETALASLPKLFAKTTFLAVAQVCLRGHVANTATHIPAIGKIDLGKLSPPSYASWLDQPAVDFVDGHIRALAKKWQDAGSYSTSAIDGAVIALVFVSTLYNTADVSTHIFKAPGMKDLLKTLPAHGSTRTFADKFASLIKTKKLRTRSTRFMVTKGKDLMVASLRAYLSPDSLRSGWREESSMEKLAKVFSSSVGGFLGGTVIHRDALLLLSQEVLAQLAEAPEGSFAANPGASKLCDKIKGLDDKKERADFLGKLVKQTFEEGDKLLAEHSAILTRLKVLNLFKALLSSSIERLAITEEGLTCDPMRWLQWLETGVVPKGFTKFTAADLEWWIQAKCKAPWLRKKADGTGWMLDELDFSVLTTPAAKELAKVAHKMLEQLLEEKDIVLPDGFRALIRRLDAEKATEDDEDAEDVEDVEGE